MEGGMRGLKVSNEYAQKLGRRYSSTPKSVIAAVAVSLLVKDSGTDDFEGVLDAFVKEWATLYLAGIIPQKPRTTNSRQRP
jgi:hypothetical protein